MKINAKFFAYSQQDAPRLGHNLWTDTIARQ
jgi:hypothetical protein